MYLFKTMVYYLHYTTLAAKPRNRERERYLNSKLLSWKILGVEITDFLILIKEMMTRKKTLASSLSAFTFIHMN